VNRRPSTSPLLVLLLFVVDAFQMLFFAVNPSPSMPFPSSPLGQSLFRVLQPLAFVASPRGAPLGALYPTPTLFALAAGWAATNLLVLLYAVYVRTLKDDVLNGTVAYRPHWPTALLRVLARVHLHALQVPVFYALLTPFEFSCAGGGGAGASGWGNSSAVACFSGPHVATIAVSVVLVPLTLLYTLLVATMLINRSQATGGGAGAAERSSSSPSSSRSVLAVSHGRVNAVLVLLKFVVSAVFVFALPGGADNAVFLLVVALLAGLVWLVSFGRYLPYHLPWVNEAQCAIAGIYTSAAVCGLLGLGAGKDPTDAVEVYAWFFTAPLAAFAGWAIAFLARRGYHSRRRELSSPFMVELQARVLLAELLEEDEAAGTSSSSSSSVAGQRTAGGRSGGGYERLDNGRMRDIAAVGIAARDARLRHISTLFEDALAAFPSSALLELFAATFLGTVRKNRHLELVHLRAAAAKADTSALDIRFFVAERVFVLEEEEASSNTVKTSVVRRLQFDSLLAEASRVAMKSRHLALAFWTEACEKRPDMGRMQATGAELIASIAQGDNVYRQLLAMAPQSTSVMRAYADFLLEIANSPKRAIELLDDAEQIEEDESKARAAASADATTDYPFMVHAPDFDLSNENVALIRMSGEPSSLGVIVDANMSALKMLGYARRELVGKNIDNVVPDPIAGVHQRFLEKYIATGEETVVNTSRIYLGLHRSGYIFPMSCNVRPVENGFGAVMEELTTSQASIIFMGAWGKWKVTACCKTSMALLGMTVTEVKAGHIFITKLLPDLVDPNAVGAASHTTAAARAAAAATDAATMVAGTTSATTTADLDVLGAGAATTSRRGDDAADSWRTRLMIDLLAAHSATGAVGVDVEINVLDWSRAALANDRERRQKVSLGMRGYLSPLGGTGGPSASPAAAAAAPLGRRNSASRQASASVVSPTTPGRKSSSADEAGGAAFSPVSAETVTAANRVIRRVPATAKLQEIAVPFLPGPIYYLRWVISRKDADEGAGEGAGGGGGWAGGGVSGGDDDGSTASAGGGRSIGSASVERSDGGSRDDDKEVVRATHVAFAGGQLGAQTTTVGAHRTPGGDPADSHLPQLVAPHGFDADLERVGSAEAPAPGSGAAGQTTQAQRRRTAAAAVAAAAKADARLILASQSGAETPKPGATSTGRTGTDDEKGRGSVGSGGSGNSSAVSDALRRGIALRGRHMETSLKNLRSTLCFVFLVVAIMNIATLVVSVVLFDSLRGFLDTVQQNGERGIALQFSYAELQRLGLMAEGALLTSDNGTATKLRLEARLNEFDVLHHDLYSRMDETDPRERALYSLPSLVVEDLVDGTFVTRSIYNATNRTVNLANGGLEYLAKARQVLPRPYELDTIDEKTFSVFWLLQNGPTTIRDACNASMLIAQDKTKGITTTIGFANTIVLGVALGLLLLVTAAVMVPAVNGALRQKSSVFAVFLETPMPILRSLRARTEAKITAMVRATDESEAGLDVAGAGDASDLLDGGTPIPIDGNGGGGVSAVTSALLVSGAGSADGDGTDEPGGKRRGSRTAAAKGGSFVHKKKKGHHKRTFAHTVTVGSGNIAAFIWPMLIMVAYYVGESNGCVLRRHSRLSHLC
jgi:PAS domain S-box-containing protein